MRISDWSSDVCSSDLHFDAFKIVEIGHALRRTGDINAVDIDADRGVVRNGRLQVALAAHRHIGEAGRRRRTRGDDQAGSGPLKTGHVPDLSDLERPCVKAWYGTWRRLTLFSCLNGSAH